ncbi:hypothetical protein NQ318_010859 [Aromia moschata]|uniref:DUF4817 domain-containing protein n=1 Tax=Aromia moschata TaxID=1265417 RepID=A0AAV8YJ40_9CUCU|nr:hypothetical protein NQ318_010859 [Aromia moschata]
MFKRPPPLIAPSAPSGRSLFVSSLRVEPFPGSQINNKGALSLGKTDFPKSANMVTADQVSNFLDIHPDFLERYVMDEIEVEQLERWIIRKSQRMKKKPESSSWNGRKTSLSRWKFCVHADKRQMLQDLTQSLQSKPTKDHVLWELAHCISSAVSADGFRARTQCEVVRLFRETHPDLPPLNQGTISKIEAQYREMGHVRKVPSKRQAVVDDDTKLNLLLTLEENSITPARQLSSDSNLNHKTVLKILEYEKNAHIKCKLFKSYLKMIQIDERNFAIY